MGGSGKQWTQLLLILGAVVLLLGLQHHHSDVTNPWIWASLIVPAAVSLMHTAFFEIWIKPYIGQPPVLFSSRNIRARHLSRRGILLYRILDGEIRVKAATSLFRDAVALTGDPELREVLDTALNMLDDTSGLTAAMEGRVLAALPPHPSRPRSPKLGLRIPLKRLILTGAIFATWFCAALFWALSPESALGATNLPLVIAVFWFFWAIGSLNYEVWFSWKTARCLEWFVTLIVSDSKTSGELKTLAQELYWRVGKVLVLEINDRDDNDTLVWTLDGTEYFVFPREKMDAAVNAVSDEIDFAVAITENMELAKQALDSIDLPTSHRRVINFQCTAPPGYQWIELAALAADPGQPELFSETRPVFTRYSRRMPNEGAGWEVNMSLAASLGFFWIPGGVFASVILAVNAAAMLILRNFAVQRRLRASTDLCRAPRSPSKSARLQPGRLKSRLTWAGALLTILAVLPVVIHYFASGATEGRYLALLLGTLLAVLVPSCVVLIGMRYCKWRLDQDFRILVFRRNSGKFGYALIEHIMGTLGKFGQVLLLDHQTLQSYAEGPRNDHTGNRSHWSYFFAEPDLQINISDLRPDWRRTCLMELELVDFAVFDWSEKVTEAMEWELEMAAKILPPERILIILNEGVSAQAALEDLPAEIRRRIRVEMIPREPDEQYIWSNHDNFSRRFDAIVLEMMEAMIPVKRPTQVVAVRGAWPFPL